MDIIDETDLMIASRQRTRSTFLTVLCVFTWIGSFIIIIQSLIMVYLYGELISSSNSFLKSSSNEVGWMYYSGVIGFICSLGCVAGAIFMWNLKRIGYYIYLFAQLTPIIFLGFILLSNSSGNIEGLVLWLFITSIIPIAFIVMYSLNLKDLK